MDLEKRDELYKKGSGALEVGRLDDAESFFTEILDSQPEDVDTLNKMGVLHVYREDREKAYQLFEHCLQINPDHVAALSNLANLELEEGKENKAEMLYRQALKIDPEYGPAHNNLAYILKKTGRISEAVKHMRKAQKAGTFSIDQSSKSTNKINRGCLTIIVLGLIALVLWYLTTLK